MKNKTEFLPDVVPESPLLNNLLDDANGAPISLREVIAAGLCHPEHGYYTMNIRTVGRTGDFTTTPQLTRILGRAVANWLRKNRNAAARKGRCSFIELGAGTGELMSQVQKDFGVFERLGWSANIVDISGPLRRLQQALLKKDVLFHDDITAALIKSHGNALIYGHEFADAFAPTILQRNEGIWRELVLSRDENQKIKLHFSEKIFPEDLEGLSHAEDGQRIELPIGFCEWLEKIRPKLNRAVILLIDYGGETQEIYRRRKNGTLRSYSHHIREVGLAALARLGRCDITYDVDFSYVSKKALQLGFKVSEVRSLNEFFADYGGMNFKTENNHEIKIIGDAFCYLELKID